MIRHPRAAINSPYLQNVENCISLGLAAKKRNKPLNMVMVFYGISKVWLIRK